MSVYVSVRIPVDPAKFEEVASGKGATFREISERAKSMGAIHHRFVATDDAVLVIDEWDSAESFQKFFASNPEIGGLMREAGVTSEPQVTFFRPVNLGDEF